MKAFFLAVIVVLAAACSSAPPAPEGIHDRRDQAENFRKLGQQAFLAARYDQSLTFFLNAAAYDTAVDDEEGMAASWNSVATAQLALGHREEALRSLDLAEQMAKASQKRNLILQVAANRVQADLSGGKPQDAKARLDALAPFPDSAEGAELWHASAAVEKSLGDIPAAMAAVGKALDGHRKLKLDDEAAADLFLLATLQGHEGQWTQAKATLLQALTLDRKMENTMGLGQDWRALGTVNRELKDLTAARDGFERSQRIFGAAALKDQQKRSLELLLETAKALGAKDEIERVQGLLTSVSAP